MWKWGFIWEKHNILLLEWIKIILRKRLPADKEFVKNFELRKAKKIHALKKVDFCGNFLTKNVMTIDARLEQKVSHLKPKFEIQSDEDYEN